MRKVAKKPRVRKIVDAPGVLVEALKKFKGGKAWIKGTFHRHTRSGDLYCSLGAIRAVRAPQELKNQASELLSGVMNRGDVVGFNDSSQTKFDQVKAKFCEAIKLGLDNKGKK